MAVTADLGEVWAALVTAWRADADLTALLGSATSVFREYPAQAPRLPSLIIECRALNPKGSTGYGVFNPSLQLNVYSKDSDLGRRVFAQLQETLQIPTQRAAEIATTNFRLTQLRVLDCNTLGPFASDDYGENVFHAAIEATCKVERKA
jgi:hypothetical protein